VWHKGRIAVDRTDVRFHDLQHSGLTWAAATGASTAELMRRAGTRARPLLSAISTPLRIVTVPSPRLSGTGQPLEGGSC
jgi:hypothetical protein